MSNVLEVSGLRKEFGGLVAVRDVSFTVGEGEFVGLIGPKFKKRLQEYTMSTWQDLQPIIEHRYTQFFRH